MHTIRIWLKEKRIKSVIYFGYGFNKASTRKTWSLLQSYNIYLGYDMRDTGYIAIKCIFIIQRQNQKDFVADTTQRQERKNNKTPTLSMFRLRP